MCLSKSKRVWWAVRDILLKARALGVDLGTEASSQATVGNGWFPPHKVRKGLLFPLLRQRGKRTEHSVTHSCLMKAGRKPGESKLQVQNVQMLESPTREETRPPNWFVVLLNFGGRRKGHV